MMRNIKAKCLERGITLKEACKQARVDYTSLYRWDLCSPSVDKVLRIAKVLDCEVSELAEIADYR